MKSFEIAGIEVPNRYIQAPLAGYTSYPMRHMAYKFGCGLAYTEMVSCNALIYNNEKTIKMLPQFKEEGLVALQLFGGDINTVLSALDIVQVLPMHYDFLDFNFGCPVQKVLKQGAGSKWLERLDEMYELLRLLTSKSIKPVICKIRLGFKDFNYLQVAKLCEDAGVKAIAVHGRTQKEGFAGEVHYSKIREIKNEISIPVIANGNISSDNILEVGNLTASDAFMIGRAAIGNPKIFKDLIDIENGVAPSNKDIHKQAELCLEHLEYEIKDKGEHLACEIMRGISAMYFKGFVDSKTIRTKLVNCSSYEDYCSVLLPLIQSA
ncbi:MAG: tRNA-dihydrouridine synthase family protein [Firmicutes bacterium]|uniref:tRNA-dihydrouridine synthase n=1 Tax=Candidatus Scatoplasma merdavium TaxID=2840932 RepID=A0A9D9DA82_9BACL|nr:tRNA-dihydrouridine synthase family protein [Candidatus Scatoplasma merdavium]